MIRYLVLYFLSLSFTMIPTEYSPFCPKTLLFLGCQKPIVKRQEESFSDSLTGFGFACNEKYNEVFYVDYENNYIYWKLIKFRLIKIYKYNI